MTGLTYLDFDLSIQPFSSENAAYPVRIMASPAGEASGVFTLPFAPDELAAFLAHQPVPRNVDDAASPVAQGDPVAMGAALFSALFDGEILGAWRASVATAVAHEEGLRLRLRLADVPELAALPWEFLRDPTLDKSIVLSAKTPVVRYLDVSRPVAAFPVDPPLRIMGVVSSPSDYPALNAEQEWANLEAGVADLVAQGKVVLTRLDDANLAAMQGILRRSPCNILHYIGHGGVDPEDGSGVLVMENEAGEASLVSAERLGALLEGHEHLRLAVLNSCEGGRSAPGNAFAGTAQTLVKQGVPSVIAMQFEITDSAAVAFSREFYAALADLYPVDAAVAEARKAIYFQDNDREWATPVLYLRTPDARIFQPKTSADPVPNPVAPDQAAPATPTSSGTSVSVSISSSNFSSGGPISIGNVGGGLSAPHPSPEPDLDTPLDGPDLGLLPEMEADIRTHLTRLIKLEDKVLFAEDRAEEARWQSKADAQRRVLLERLDQYESELKNHPAYTPPTDVKAAQRHVDHA